MRKVLIEALIVTAAQDFSVKAGDEVVIINGFCSPYNDNGHETTIAGSPAVPSPPKIPPKKTHAKRKAFRIPSQAELKARRTLMLQTIKKNQPIVSKRLAVILEFKPASSERSALQGDLEWAVTRQYVVQSREHSQYFPAYSVTDKGLQFIQFIQKEPFPMKFEKRPQNVPDARVGQVSE